MKPKHLYLVSLASVLVCFTVLLLGYDQIPDPIPTRTDFQGNTTDTEPKSVLTTTWGVWFSLVVLALFYVAGPRPSLAHSRFDVPADSPIPFSQSEADKAEALLTLTEKLLAWFALAVVVPLCLGQLTILPAYAHLKTASLILTFAALIAAGVATFMAYLRWPAALKEMPTDEEEKIRKKHFGYGTGLGIYNEPADPMALMIGPTQETQVVLNWAHRPARTYVWTVTAAFVLLLAVSFLPFVF